MDTKRRFFEKKRQWSLIKDAVLETYLEPYLAKIARFAQPVRIADAFAGKGCFDDGTPGSPLIICNAIRKQLSRQENKALDIKAVLIEKRHTAELTQNVSVFRYARILDGNYADRMQFLVEQYPSRGKHLFLYVDPFGIKSLLFSHFQALKKTRFETMELLLNMNAFGFLREGCRLLDLAAREETEKPAEYDADVNSPERLDSIAGGDYWRDIVCRYHRGEMQMGEAEGEFSRQYCARMREIFKYVIDIPIKARIEHIPKYRIVFGTNHADGLLLMADNMNRRWEEFRLEQSAGQSTLFEVDFPSPSALEESFKLEESILREVSQGEIELRDLLISLIERYGICFSPSRYVDILKRLESDKAVRVRRDPARTPTGRRCTGWNADQKRYRVYISRVEQWQPSLPSSGPNRRGIR